MAQIKLKLLGRDYDFAVSDDEVASLREAAEAINGRARALSESGQRFSTERMAILTALQIAFDAIEGKIVSPREDAQISTRLMTLSRACEEALNKTHS